MEYDVGISSRKKEKGTGREMGMLKKKKRSKRPVKMTMKCPYLKSSKRKKKKNVHTPPYTHTAPSGPIIILNTMH